MPLLIVPGFMSSGLEVRSSSLKPEWCGQRIWMSMTKLGFHSMHTEGVFESFQPCPQQHPPMCAAQQMVPENSPLAQEEGRAQCAPQPPNTHGAGVQMSQQAMQAHEQQQRHLKNRWLEHLILKSAHEETPGMAVRAIEGFSGIDFLEHGALSHLTYVFGPVIKALRKHGYKEGDNVEAASYDWRLSPSVLHSRDGHFEDMARRIERLDRGSGVVVLGHSMGNKVVQYFLSYMKKTRGQEWLDRYVYSWVSCGSPTLGASKAFRTTLTGDCMGLESFLSMNEAITMARSFSSSPWLFPLGAHANSLIYVRRQGLLEVRCVSGRFKHVPLRATSIVELNVQVNWGSFQEVLRTGDAVSFDGQDAVFRDTSILHFGGPPVMPPGASLQVLIKEKKRVMDQFGQELSVCCLFWACMLFPITVLIYLCRLCRGVVHLANVVEEWSSGRGAGIARGATGLLSLAGLEQQRGRWVDVSLDMPKQSLCCCCRCFSCCWRTPGTIKVQVRWRSADDLRAECGLPPRVVQQAMGVGAAPVRHCSRPAEVYDLASMKEVMRLEGCGGVERMWDEHFVGDPLYDHTGAADCPPVKRVVAINGVNVPTEVGLVLRLNSKRADCKGDLLSRLALDTEAALVPDTDWARRCSIKGGVLWEEPGRGRDTGDGTVPAVSLFHAREWQGRLDYREVNLDGAGHREMLADHRFHAALLKEALTREPGSGGSPVAATE